MTAASEIADARPRVVAALAAQFRDLDMAEDAFAAACEALVASGAQPRDLAAWLYVTARRRALDGRRRAASEAKALALMAAEASDMAEILPMPDPIPDERLRLLFTCCHPALGLEARAALALRVVCGVPVGRIAEAFLVAEPAMYQRLTRAKAKIREANIPFETPGRRQWPERLEAVLATLEIAYSVAFRDARGQGDADGLGAEVLRLAALLAELVPEEAEALGLAALVALAHSRRRARVGVDGAMVPLSRQDTQLWDHALIARAAEWLEAAHALGRNGPLQVMAAIHFLHAQRACSGRTDWPAIAALYDTLARMRPTSVVAINRAVALGRARGAERGLAALGELDAQRMANFLPFQVAQADLLEQAGRAGEAAQALRCALALGPGEAERLFLERRLTSIMGD